MNHYEIDGDGFDSLLDGGDNEPTPTSTPEPVTAGGVDDGLITEPPEPVESPTNEPSKEPEPENGDFWTSFLNEYGLKDGKVTYQNDDDTTEEVDFNELDLEEKRNILKELIAPNYHLSKDEMNTIKYLRDNNATIQDVITYYSQKAIEDYIKENGPVEKEYSVDEYTDDELYVADLKAKFSEMTDEDAQADLEIAKENEALFKKKVEAIRKQYKAREEESAKEIAAAQEEQYNNFKTSLENQLNDFNEISMDYKDSKSDRLQIEDSEKEEIYKYILNRDENGASQFFKDLNNPKTLVELAWFALYGKDAISDISNYWKSQLKNIRQKPENKSQTTVVNKDDKTQKDNFISRHKSVELTFDESLL